MAYAALASLARAIDQILLQEQDYAFLCGKEQMQSLYEQIVLLQELLDCISMQSFSLTSDDDLPESQIRDVAYKLEDIIESVICRSLGQEFESDTPLLTWNEFCDCIKEAGFLLKKLMKMKTRLETKKSIPRALSHFSTRSSVIQTPSAEDANVGIGDDLNRILGQITGQESNRTIIPIIGMGGIGKTTLARAVYEHLTTVNRFDIRVWVTVSGDFRAEDVFRGILSAEQQAQVSNGNFLDSAYRRLLERRYLVVLDDVWDYKVWDEVRRAFPDNNNHSRVIITTRVFEVAKSVAVSGDIHEMKLLSEEHSWDLLREKVYGQECRTDFEEIGRTISNNCKGLPLAIVVVAGMIKSNKMEKEHWNEIARNTREKAASDSEHLLEILSLSYTYLPSHLKACFLYMGSFKEDYEIPTKEIAMMWTAEGFLPKPKDYKRMEEIAEECLEKLVERSLVLVTERGYNGKIKTSSVHDVLREVSQTKSQEETFLHYFKAEDTNEVSFRNIINVQRRVSFSSHKLFEFPHDLHDTSVRSILTKYPVSPRQLSNVIHHFQLLRVMYKVLIEKASDLSSLFRLANLRYLHFVRKDTSPPLEVPGSISNLQNLETLIFSGRLPAGKDRYELVLPEEIWKMPSLRHIVLMHKSKLLFPSPSEDYPVLESLQTLSWVTNFVFSTNAIEKITDIKKLGVACRIVAKNDSQQFHLDNLIYLHKLEELAIWCEYDSRRPNFAFPENLKKLSLERTKIPWKDMSIVGKLPCLEKLKLKWASVTGKEWVPNKGEFLSLKYLKMDNLVIQDWEAECGHFPKLETLIIVLCGQLKKIPSEIGEIETLTKLIVKDCKYILDSVDGIRQVQDDYGNTDLVNVSDDEDFLPVLFD